MAYSHTNSKGVQYFLHSRETELRGGRKQRIFFFAKTVRDDALDAVPQGMVVAESRNGLPVLKKIR